MESLTDKQQEFLDIIMNIKYSIPYEIPTIPNGFNVHAYSPTGIYMKGQMDGFNLAFEKIYKYFTVFI